MDGRQKPDPQNESGNDLNDKDVIDLTEVVEEGNGDDVIDLNDILEQPDQAAQAAVEPEEEATPLVNALSEEADDEIIDLTDMTESAEAPAVEPVAESVAAPSDGEADEAVIDLMDVATSLEADLVAAEPDVSASTPEETVGITQDEDDVIDLLEAVEPQAAEAETTVETNDAFTDLESRAEAVLTGAGDAYDVEAAETAGPDGDFMVFEDTEAIIDETEAFTVVDDQPKDAPDVPEPLATPPFVPVSQSEPGPLTEAQVESALERTIEKIYGEKIEQLMIQAIEKTVKREIEKIKRALLEEDDDMIG